MSKKGINLLGEKKQALLSPAIKKLRTLRFIAIGLLFMISTFSVILFLLITLSPLPSLQKQEQNALSLISTLHPEIAKLKLIDDRVKASDIILQKRKNFDKALEAAKSKMPSGLSVTALTLKDKDVSLTVTSPSLALLNTFLNDLTALVDSNKTFFNATLDSLISNQQQNLFTMTVNLVIL